LAKLVNGTNTRERKKKVLSSNDESDLDKFLAFFVCTSFCCCSEMSRFVAFLLFIELRTFQTRALCFQDRNPCSKSQLLSKSESRPDRALVLGGQFHNGVLFANSPLSCTLWLPSQVVQVANHFSVELLTFFSFTRSSAKNSAGVTSYVASCCCDLPAWLFVKSKLIAELLPNSYRFAKLWNCMQRPIWLKACNTECVRVLLLFILF